MSAAAVPTLTGRVAIVTGGSSGIGRAIAETLSAAQARVVIAARTIDRLEEAAAAISERTGQPVDAIACDTRDQASIDRLVELVLDRHGRIDILVNCAANPSGLTGDIGTLDGDALLRDLDTKVVGYARCIRAVSGAMKRQAWGRIVNIGGFTGRTSDTLSGLRNAAVSHLTKTVSDQLGLYGIAVNALHPGIVRTPHLEELFEDQARAQSRTASDVEADFVKDTPARRLLEPKEIGRTALFLAADMGTGITGQSIAVDGGYTRGIYL
jgi:NAD(P)-dependent dehydrogenase (short-subunit alcohol dehydrogenase family)